MSMCKPLQYSCLENPVNSMKRQNNRILKEEFPRSVGAQIATGDQWRNNSRKNEGMELKQKQYPVVDVTGDRSKVGCCKEQYCIGTWNVRSMNQGKLEVDLTLQVPMQYCSLQHWTLLLSPVTSTAGYYFWFILSGVISPLISSSILGTYWPGEFLFQQRPY